MEKTLFLIIFFSSFLWGDYLDVTVQKKSGYKFEEYLFKDINITNTEKLQKEISYDELHLSGNFNSIIGFNYYTNNINSPDKFDSQEIYIGSDKTKFLGYQKDKTEIHYGARKNTAKTIRYTIYDILTIEQNELNSEMTETFYPGTPTVPTDINTSQTDMVYRVMDYQKIILSSENLYNHVRENAIEKDNYFNFGAISQNIGSMFRIYGVLIASYEQHDYDKGAAGYYADINGTKKLTSIYNGSVADRDKLVARDGKFKGFGYGYKITAEAYWKDMSLFVTSYYKKTDLKNYHTDIRDAEAGAEAVANVIANDKLTFLQKYTSFGLNYRF